MTARQCDIGVYADWQMVEKPLKMGQLSATQLPGKEVFSFAYDPAFLSTGLSQVLDPDLQFFGGNQFIRDEKPNFGLFLDSSPDRWGRLLMRRREALVARQEARKEKPLFESDYLLGVYDEHRMGAIRFKTDDTGDFLNNNRAMAAPPCASWSRRVYNSNGTMTPPRLSMPGGSTCSWLRGRRWGVPDPKPASATRNISYGLPSFRVPPIRTM
ncbi:hypothetical protein [Spirosoma spitsbergense]|uniref:hypothetical protein n=1 Tax=Spirosoma spitsbergense TaxID=431554 RepID=UPI0003AA42BA|nr:hypothetical protein [Spirosoma spitsbergense]